MREEIVVCFGAYLSFLPLLSGSCMCLFVYFRVYVCVPWAWEGGFTRLASLHDFWEGGASLS